jgi:hypothetical protein
MIVSRSRVARKRIKERPGGCEEGIPYGWMNQGPVGDKRLVPVEAEQRFIQSIFVLREDRWTFRAIADYLNRGSILIRRSASYPPIPLSFNFLFL